MSHTFRRFASVAAVSALAMVGAGFSAGGNASATVSHTQINGSGSSWAANAVNQWIADVSRAYGYQVSFTSTGSAQGRKDFAYKTTDFGVSDIAYQGADPLTGEVDSSLGRQFAYLPIVAGGTSFPYNLSVAGKRIRNLRLSGGTIAKIFTNQIGYWDDPRIKADNNGKLALPHIAIIPVVHSEGSGSTYQFTAYLASLAGSDGNAWGNFNGGQNRPTEYFPRQGAQVAQNGSDGVINFITSAAGSGTIGFDEYSYALGANFPVIKLLNSSGYFTAPTQYNDAVALTAAHINMNPSDPAYLTQDLHDVYTNPDPRTYPMSSYSYMIIPTGANDPKTNTTAQRQTIADFLYYSICPGQAEMGPIGYSPLPLVLVQAGFTQIAKLKQADPNVDLTNRNPTTCNNPTFDPSNLAKNRLAEIAPQPPACDKLGQGPCTENVGLVNGNPVGGSAPSGGQGSTSGSNGGSGSSSQQTGSSGSTPRSTTNNRSASAKVDPNTGQLVFGDAPTSSAGGGDVNPVATTLAADSSPAGLSATLYLLIFAMLVAVFAGPIAVSRYWSRHADPANNNQGGL